ncbi:MAG: L-fucose/L-arabinose isomerase family protein [Candidatus Omnitrophica bacterium]|nr:L-fucose/L-arabinose isomerase family protein [Candidatus Omnitrophota bacterium]
MSVNEKMEIGLIVGNRGFFPDHLCQSGRAAMVKLLEEKNIKVIALPENSGKFGSVETIQDAKKCAELFKKHRETLTGIIVTLPNFGDERAVADTIRWSGLEVPILVHAWPDDPKKMDVANRRDSFCGKISVCNNLNQYGLRFSLTNFHTVSPESPSFQEDLDQFVGVCRVLRGLKNVRLGAVGARPAAFKTVRYSEKILEQEGISVDTLDLSELLAAAEKLSDTEPEVINALKEIQAYSDTSKVTLSSLKKIARFKLVLDRWVRENDFQAIAVQCWSSLQANFGVMPCVAMSMLSQSLIPAACEVDILGALSMYILQLASGQPSALVDWNNNYQAEPDKAVIFHCSNFPVSYFEKSHLYMSEIIAGTVGQENATGTLYGRVKAGPFSFLRLTTSDSTGNIRGYLGEGKVTADPVNTFGGYSVVEIEDLQSLLQIICQEGYEHHVAINLSRCARVIEEALSHYRSWPLYVNLE